MKQTQAFLYTVSIWNLTFYKGCRRKWCQKVWREIRQIFEQISKWVLKELGRYLLTKIINTIVKMLGECRWTIRELVRLVCCSLQVTSSWVWHSHTSIILLHVALPKDYTVFCVLCFLGSVFRCQLSRWHWYICNVSLIMIL